MTGSSVPVAHDPLKILVMTDGWQSTLSCIQSLGRRGHHVYVLGGENLSVNSYSSLLSGIARGKEGLNTEQYVKGLLRFIEQGGIDIVIPITDNDAYIAASLKQESPLGERFVVGSLDAVRTARSRNSTVELCNKLGIRTPATEFVTHGDAALAAGKIGYPCWLKVSGSVASQGVYRLADRTDLDRALERIPSHAEFQIQAEIEGDLADITATCRDGKVLGSFSFSTRYDMSHSGTPPHATVLDDARLEGILDKIVHALRWTGGIDLDLLMTPDGDFALLEINPRLSGTSVFALKRGIDLPAGYLPPEIAPDVLECTAENAQATGFISLVEEAMYLRNGGPAAVERALAFRRGNACTDNAFWDDPRYSKALFQTIQSVHLSSGFTPDTDRASY